jgi:hypothetical protein
MAAVTRGARTSDGEGMATRLWVRYPFGGFRVSAEPGTLSA